VLATCGLLKMSNRSAYAFQSALGKRFYPLLAKHSKREKKNTTKTSIQQKKLTQQLLLDVGIGLLAHPRTLHCAVPFVYQFGQFRVGAGLHHLSLLVGFPDGAVQMVRLSGIVLTHLMEELISEI